jgi:hypothetical protein
MNTRRKIPTTGWASATGRTRRSSSGSLTHIVSPWANAWSFDPRDISVVRARKVASKPGEMFADDVSMASRGRITGPTLSKLQILTVALLALSALFAGVIFVALLYR